MPRKNSEKKINKYIHGLTKTLSEAGLYREEEVATKEDIEKIKSKVKIHSWIMVGVIVAMLVAFCGFVVDTIIFHIAYDKYFEDVYYLRNNCQQRIDDMSLDLEKIKNNHPEVFNN